MTSLRALPVLLLLSTLTACGADAARDEAPGVAEWSIEEVVRIGSVDDPAQALTEVGVVMLAPDGRIHVAQPQDVVVRVFAPDGSAEGVIGRRGEGPGEFRSVRGGMWFRGDTLVVGDITNDRVSKFAPDGTFLDSREWPTTSWFVSEPTRRGYMISVPEVMLPDGSGIALTAGMVAGGGPPQAQAPALMRGFPVVRFDTAGTILDTLAWQQYRAGRTLLNFEGRPLGMAVPVNDGALVAIARDGGGAVVAERTLPPGPEPAWLLRRIATGGDTAFARSIPYTPVPLPDAYVTRLAEERAAAYSRGAPGLTGAQIEGAWRDADFVPETLPPVTELVATQDGRIWVRREEPAEGQSARWEVFAADGELRAVLRLPARQQVVAARDGLMVALELDDLDVPYLVVYRLPAGSSAG